MKFDANERPFVVYLSDDFEVDIEVVAEPDSPVPGDVITRCRSLGAARAAAETVKSTIGALAFRGEIDDGQWNFVGAIGVDAGMILISDPSYVQSGIDYDRWIREALGKPPVSLTAVVPCDDGLYPVEMRREGGSPCTEIRIRLDQRLPQEFVTRYDSFVLPARDAA